MNDTPIQILIVDDSAIFRNLWSIVFKPHSNLKVVGVAENGQVALEKIKNLRPQLVLLDIEMPIMDGFATLEAIKRDYPEIKVIIASSLSLPSSEAAIKCLTMGASDYVTKPTQAEIDSVGKILIDKILNLFKKKEIKQIQLSNHKIEMKHLQIIAIGSSTGGPNALLEVLRNLSPEITAPIMITQHMPPLFTKSLADKIGKDTKRKTQEGKTGLILEKNCIYIAPGDFHMGVSLLNGSYVITTNQKPPENFCRPAVDPMFRSISDIFGANALAIILTGMGQDGLEGCKILKAKGAPILAQDQESSVVWGMPGAIVQAQLANQVLNIKQIAPKILEIYKKYP